MIRVQAADRELKSKEARIVFYLSYIVRYLRAQSAKEPESARWVGVLDVRVPHGYKGGCSCESRPDFIRQVSTDFPKGYGPALEAPQGGGGGVTWRATDWIHLFTMRAYFLARKVGGRKMDPELRVEPFFRTSQAFVSGKSLGGP